MLACPPHAYPRPMPMLLHMYVTYTFPYKFCLCLYIYILHINIHLNFVYAFTHVFYIYINIGKRLCFNIHAFQYTNYHFIHTCISMCIGKLHTSVGGDEAQGPLPTPGALPPSHPTPSQVGDGLGRDGAMLSLGGGGFDYPEGGYLALLEATDELPQEWTGETITYESVPLISYTPRQLVIDVCAHVKRYIILQNFRLITQEKTKSQIEFHFSFVFQNRRSIWRVPVTRRSKKRRWTSLTFSSPRCLLLVSMWRRNWLWWTSGRRGPLPQCQRRWRTCCFP